MPTENNIKASVIIPVYNDPAGIVECLDALGEQTFPASDFEVIVVDNNSSPPLEIPGDYPFGVTITVCERPGAYAARNAGFEKARGNILAFTDADCLPERNWLYEGVHCIEKQKGAVIAGGEILFLQPAIKTGVALYQLATGFEQKVNIENKHFSATANLFCTREQFQRIGGFDENLLSGGDRLWCWQARKLGYHLLFLPEAIIYTWPRTNLRKAMTQARRVAGGRFILRGFLGDDESVSETHIAPHRNFVQSLAWLLSCPGLSLNERIKVFMAAALIKLSRLLETFLLHLGKKPERR